MMAADALLQATLFGVALVVVVALGVWWLTRRLMSLPSTDSRDRLAGLLVHARGRGMTPELNAWLTGLGTVAEFRIQLEEIRQDPAPEEGVPEAVDVLLAALDEAPRTSLLKDRFTQMDRGLAALSSL